MIRRKHQKHPMKVYRLQLHYISPCLVVIRFDHNIKNELRREESEGKMKGWALVIYLHTSILSNSTQLL